MSEVPSKVQLRAIEEIRNPSLSNYFFRDALREAAEKGWTHVLKEGFRLRNVTQVSRDRLLLVATRLGRDNVDAVDFLLSAGANPNTSGVLATCAASLLPLMIRYGGDLELPGDDNPLLASIITRTKQDKSLTLIELGANVNVADVQGVTALMHAAALGRNRTFDALIEAGADLYAVDKTGRTVARHVAESFTGGTHQSTESDLKNATRIARQLQKMLPAQPEDQILLAIALGEADKLKTMIDSGLDPNTLIADSMGLVGLSKDDLIQRLSEHGGFVQAIVNNVAFPSTQQRDEEMGGMTLLMWATAMRQIDCMRVLLDNGADANLANKGGVSALSIAQSRNNTLVTSMLAGIDEKRNAQTKGELQHCHQLGFSESEIANILSDCSLRIEENRDKFRGRGSCYLIEMYWEVVCLNHLLGRTKDCRKSLFSILELADEFFFGPHFQDSESEVRQLKARIEWIPSFVSALAAASSLGEQEKLERFATYPTKGCYRGDKSPTFGLEWYEWPLWRHIGSLARGEEPDPKWLNGMKKDSTRKSKAMLAAFEAIDSGKSKQVQKAVDRIVQAEIAWQKKNWDGIQPYRCVSAEATFFFCDARSKSLNVEFLDTWQPHLLNFS